MIKKVYTKNLFSKNVAILLTFLFSTTLVFSTKAQTATCGLDAPFSLSDGAALDFDGVDDHIEFFNIDVSSVSDYTIELWFKMDTYPTRRENLFDFGTDWNIRQYVGIEENDFRYTISIWNGEGVTASDIVSSELPTLNEWHHVAVAYSDSNRIGTLYLDGKEVGSNTLEVKPQDFQSFGQATRNYIGRSKDFEDNRFFKGQIDNFNYRRAYRTAEEIADNRFCRLDDLTDVLIYTNFEDGVIGGDNAGVSEVGNCALTFASGFLRGFNDGTPDQFVSAEGIPPCENCEILLTDLSYTGACAGVAEGSIQLVGVCPSCENGAADLEYSIDGENFQTDTIFENLIPADYTVTFRGKNNANCVTSSNITVFAVDLAPTVVTQNLSRNRNEDGIVVIPIDEVNNGSTDDCTATENLTFSLSETSFDCNDLSSGTPCVNVTTLAGNPTVRGFADGQDTIAQFNQPRDVVVDSEGNLFVTDSRNHTIRKITPDGIVTTFIGTAEVRGFVDSTGVDAQISSPNGITIDAANNLYVADRSNQAIRKITPEGVVTTVVSQLRGANGVAIDAAGNIYIATGRTVEKITPDGTVSTLAGNPDMSDTVDGMGTEALFNRLNDLTVDNNGNVYAVDQFAHTIRKITPEGAVTTFAGVPDVNGATDGTGADATFNFPSGIEIDGQGFLYVSDQSNNSIRRITQDGIVTTLAGDGSRNNVDGLGSDATTPAPYGLGVDKDGNIYIGGASFSIIKKVTPIEGCLSTKLTVTDEGENTSYKLANITINCDMVSSVDEGLVNMPLSLSPNPVQGNFNLAFTLETPQKLNIQLINSVGQLAHQFYNNQSFPEGTNKLNLTIPTELPNGLYLLAIINDGVPVTIPLLKQ